MSRKRSLGVAFTSALFVLTTAGTALADEPVAAAQQGQSGQLVGLVNDVAGKTPAELGYTDAVVAAKEAAIRRVEAMRASASPADLLATATAHTRLSGYVEYHQKTQDQCLAATVQSILHYKYGSVWISPSVISKQATIDSHTGTSESSAITYINSQFTNGFYYAVWAKRTITTFKDAILIDINNFTMPSYTTVDVHNAEYAWHQTSPANHATTVEGYYGGSSVTSVDLDDPYTSPSTGAGCVVINGYPGYSSTPNLGCVYPSFSTSRLYHASEHQWF
jgi:hypothetical protein